MTDVGIQGDKMKITKRQLRRIIREVKLNEATSTGLLWFQEGTRLYDEVIAFDESRPQTAPSWRYKDKDGDGPKSAAARAAKDASFLQEADGGVWLTSLNAFKHEVDGSDYSYFDDGRHSVCSYPSRLGVNAGNTMDMPFAPQGARYLSDDELPPIRKKWGLIAQACREGRPLSGEQENMIDTVFSASGRGSTYVLMSIIGRLSAMDLTGLSGPGYTGCWNPKAKDGPGKKKKGKPGPYLESGSIGELMDLDPEEFPEVDDLIADYSALSAAQKIALGKIEDIGFDGVNANKFMKVLKQVGPQNFLSAFNAVASTISQIGYGSADTLYEFYSEVAELAG